MLVNFFGQKAKAGISGVRKSILHFALHFLAPVRDSENEMEMQNFEPESEEEKELLGKIKSSFRCWQKKEDSHIETKTAKSILIQLLKLVGHILGLYLLTITIGPLIGQARNIAIYFEK